MNILQKFIYSSADPERLALTLKAGIPFVLLFVGWSKYQATVDEALLNSLVEQAVNLAVLLGQLVTGAMAIYGLVRKAVNLGKTG